MNLSAPPIGSTWQAHGYTGCGNVEGLIDSLRGRTAVVCGGAEGVFEEFDHVRRLFLNPVIFAVNDVGMFLNPLDHWVSLHGDQFPAWKAVRWIHAKPPEDVRYHSHDHDTEYRWAQLTPLMALSGYFAAQIALVMGADRIILCGCPGEAGRRFFEARPRADFEYGQGQGPSDAGIKRQFLNELDRVPEFREKLRSTSGWTQKILGGL